MLHKNYAFCDCNIHKYKIANQSQKKIKGLVYSKM